MYSQTNPVQKNKTESLVWTQKWPRGGTLHAELDCRSTLYYRNHDIISRIYSVHITNMSIQHGFALKEK